MVQEYNESWGVKNGVYIDSYTQGNVFMGMRYIKQIANDVRKTFDVSWRFLEE